MILLIVDDQPTNLKLLRAQLEGEGHSVLEAADGVEALAVLDREKSVEGVISDILMPTMDGFRLCLEIRKNAKFAALPFIVYTSTYDSPEDRQLAKSVGADYYLTKPAPVAAILAALRDAAQMTRPRIAAAAARQDESVVLKKYNAALVRKLEDRNTEVEEALKNLQTAHDKTRESEERLRQLAENVREVFYLMDPAGTQMLYVSPAYEDIWKRSTASLYENPQSWTELIHPDDQAMVLATLERVQNTGQSDYEYRIVLPDGTIRWIHERSFPIRNHAGELYRVAGVAEDITERKHAAGELRRSEGLKSAIVASSLDCVVTIDHEGKIVEFNSAAEVTFGLPCEQALGKVMVDLIVPPRLRDAHRRGFAHYLATGEGPILGRRIELEAVRADGTEFPIELSITVIGGTSKPMFTSFIRDITERRRAEAGLKRLNRVYAVLSQINALIVRVRDRDELYREACSIAVEGGGFHMSLICIVNPKTMKIVPVASAGKDEELLAAIKGALSSSEDAPNTMVALAIREKTAVVSNDSQNDPRVLFGRKYAESGVRSLAILPLVTSSHVAGVLALYSSQLDSFHEGELKLLTELAGNISFALDHIGKEEKIARLSRIQAVTGGINALIVRVHDRQELFSEACRIAVEHGRFAMAWIGAFDPATQDVTPVAWAGEGAQVLTRVKSSAREGTLGGQGAVGRAIRERRPVFKNDIASNGFGGPRQKEILKLGFQSQITLPLYVGQAVVATLTMYVKDPNYFDAEELRLLTDLAGDISFALANISRQQKLDKLARIRAVSSEINAAIIRIHDRDELFREACRIAVETGAFRMAWIGVIDPQTLDGKVVAWNGGEQSYVEKVTLTARDGTPESGLPACRALRQSQPVICNDIATDPSVGPLRDDLVRRGHKSLGCFPLTVAGRPEAVICFFAGDRGVFDDEEMRLLQELAGNISLAIDHIDKQKQIDYFAYYDALTGLANRSLFVERVAQHMRSAVGDGHKLALYLIDLERFKNINDSLGQPAGDALLKQVAGWLTRNLGDASLLARVGADHFAVVLPEVKQAGDVARLLEKTIADFLEHPFRLNDAVFRITAKVGVAIFPDDGANADTLFKNAEAALKKAKASGDRYLFYTQRMTETVAGRLTLENQLRQALDKGEFVLHYQPKVSLVSGKLSSAEALIRWNDPRTGLVPPGRFIPVLEETGMIHEVGRWALRRAIEEHLRWRTAGLAAVRIAVNVSPLQLRNRGFIAEIRKAIGIDAQAAAGLELEVTESLIMEDVKHSIASLQAIRAMGVSIAVDDFGTGFSSLSYLARLPVDTLKIDRSFVVDMTASPEGLSLVSTIINLGHSLKLKVVAEGVETEEQSRLLRLLKCDEMQGFLFSKPLPVEIFEARFLAAPPAAAAASIKAEAI